MSLLLGPKPFETFLWLVFCLFYTSPVVAVVVVGVRILFYSQLSQAVLGLVGLDLQQGIGIRVLSVTHNKIFYIFYCRLPQF